MFDMKLAKVIAQHFYEVHYGDNWADVAVKDVIKDITWPQAVQRVGDANTIAVLLHHMNFYNMVVYNRCFEENQKEVRHEDSLHVEVNSDEDWQQLQKRYFDLAEKLHAAILTLDDTILFTVRPGNQNTYYKNLHGLIEHIHYHLGQISLLKKIISPSR
jgi:hypothetical protein